MPQTQGCPSATVRSASRLMPLSVSSSVSISTVGEILRMIPLGKPRNKHLNQSLVYKLDKRRSLALNQYPRKTLAAIQARSINRTDMCLTLPVGKHYLQVALTLRATADYLFRRVARLESTHTAIYRPTDCRHYIPQPPLQFEKSVATPVASKRIDICEA
jgi:hypothetical protein